MMQAAMGNADRIVDWSQRQAVMFGEDFFVGKHQLNEQGCFSDSGLISLLERYQQERLQVFCSGTDPRRFKEDWHLVAVGKATPREIITAVAKGRLWVNLQRVDLSPELGPLVRAVYEAIQQLCPRFRPYNIQASLFISSPGAVVYYHADASPNLLWHLRGKKRVWVYPAHDVRLVPQTLMEDIFAGAVDEIPYLDEFDQYAKVVELRPGDVASWPQNSPHRICNLDGINVSLTSMHWTAASERRKLVYLSNRYFRRQFKLPVNSVEERGALPQLKCFTYRVCNKLKLVPARAAASDTAYTDRGQERPRFLIDASAPMGVRPA